MTPAAFRDGPRPRGPGPLEALWLEAQGDWDGAHHAVQDDDGREAAWVHAYLHRKEGDAGNAAYWYARAVKPVFQGSPEAEWEAMVGTLLSVTKQ